MEKNIGSTDRLIRFVLGIGILSLFWIFPDTQWRWAGLIGFLPLVTAINETSLAYSLFGYSTWKSDKRV